jgi:hypothetical protein
MTSVPLPERLTRCVRRPGQPTGEQRDPLRLLVASELEEAALVNGCAVW